MFQKITEVFALRRLISSRPRGTVFQLAFCLVLYNVMVVVCGHLAAGQRVAAAAVSKEMVFLDVQKGLAGLLQMVEDDDRLRRLLPVDWTPAQVRERRRELLGGLWKPLWKKAVNKNRRPHPNKPRARGHVAVHRALLEQKEQKRSQLSLHSP